MSGKLLLIAQPDSYRIAPYIKAAQQMDTGILIASKGKYSLISEVYQGLHIDDFTSQKALRTILHEAEKHPFCGVLGCDDSTVELACRTAEKLDLPHNLPKAARISRRKDQARNHLLMAGCPVPAHRLVDLRLPLMAQIKALAFPCVVKPLNLSASQGVIRVNNPQELETACRRIHHLIKSVNADAFEQNTILAEEYIDGDEIAFEGFLQNGTLTQLAIFDKPDPLVGPYFEETIYVTPSCLPQDKQALIHQRVQQACRAYGLTIGPVHAELRINAQDAFILEVASRTIGGDCGRMLDTGQGMNIEALTIALATGQNPDIQTLESARGVMMLPVPRKGLLKRVEGLLKARKVKNITAIDILIPEGHELIPLPEGNQYPGYIFAQADSREAVIHAIREAYSILNIVIAPLWPINTSINEYT